MIVDSSDNLYVGFSESSGSYYFHYYQKFSPIGASPTTSAFENFFKVKDINPQSGPNTLVFTQGNAGILASGSFMTSSMSSWSIGYAYIDSSNGNVNYIYAA